MLSFTTLTEEVAPYVKVLETTDITAQSADLNFELISYDSEAPELTLYWGTKDQGEVEGLWQSSYEIGELQQLGAGKQRITGLSPGVTYSFRVRAKTTNKTSWSENAVVFEPLDFRLSKCFHLSNKLQSRQSSVEALFRMEVF